MSFYKELPDVISITKLRSVIDFFIKQGPAISGVFLETPKVLKANKHLVHTIGIEAKLTEHLSYIKRQENAVPGYASTDRTLFGAMSQFIIDNKADIDELLLATFGSAEIITKDNLTVRKTIVIDWLLTLNLYLFSTVQLIIRLTQVINIGGGASKSGVMSEMLGELIYLNKTRRIIREVLITDEVIATLTESSTNNVSEGLLKHQLNSTGLSSIVPNLPNMRRLELFDHTQNRIRYYEASAFDSFVSEVQQMFSLIQLIKTAPDTLKERIRDQAQDLDFSLSSISRTIGPITKPIR